MHINPPRANRRTGRNPAQMPPQRLFHAMVQDLLFMNPTKEPAPIPIADGFACMREGFITQV
ncbi:hypothetical protein JCM12296A_48370 [Desulfosarcina cetonica]